LSQFNYFGPRNFGVLLPTTLKRYCIQIFANLPGSRNSRNKGHAKKTGFTDIFSSDSFERTFDHAYHIHVMLLIQLAFTSEQSWSLSYGTVILFIILYKSSCADCLGSLYVHVCIIIWTLTFFNVLLYS